MTTEPQPSVRPAKPRLLQDGRDMFWSLAPLVAACILLAGLVGMCSFHPTGTGAGPVLPYDDTAALHADAQTLGFPIRLPELPQGWQANSGSRGSIEDGRTDITNGQKLRAVTSTVGYLTPSGRYLGLTQSDGDEERLAGSILHLAAHPTGTVDVAGTRWIVYRGDGPEPVWTTRLTSPNGSTQVAITGAGSADDFRALAAATQSQPPLPNR